MNASRPIGNPSTIGQSLVYCGAFVITIAGLRAASSVIVPLLLATFFSIICAPPLKRLQRWLPFGLALLVMMLVLAGIFITIPILIGTSLQRVLDDLPSLQQQLLGLAAEAAEFLRRWEVEVTQEDLVGAFDLPAATGLLATFLNGLLRTFGDGVLVLMLVVFMLAETAWFTGKLSIIDRGRGEASRRVSEVITSVHRYVSIKTWVSLATGVSAGAGLWLLGIEHAVVWGFIAFLLNYIPNIGSIIAGAPPVALALLQRGIGSAVLVILLYVIVNQVFGSVIEPRLQGRGLGLSPLIVFVSLLFWGWVFGAVGMLLSAPITMALKITCEVFPETRWIAILLGGQPAAVENDRASAASTGQGRAAG